MTLSLSQKSDHNMLNLTGKKLQSEIENLSEWCKRWQISLNTAKCKVMNVGRKNTEFAYTIEDDLGKRTGLAPTSNERDL